MSAQSHWGYATTTVHDPVSALSEWGYAHISVNPPGAPNVMIDGREQTVSWRVMKSGISVPVVRWTTKKNGEEVPLMYAGEMPGGTPGEEPGTNPQWTPPAARRAGAEPLGSVHYPIPQSGTVVYVSPTGADANPGTESSPKATLNGAIAVTGGSGAIILRGGVYETTSTATVPSGGSGLTIQNYPGEEVWFDGSRSATAWTNNGNGTWSTSYSPLSKISVTGLWSSSENPDGIAIADQCWIDGVRQEAIADNTTPSAGRFSVDRTNNTLTIATNPAGRQVRVSRATILMLITSPTTLRGVGVRRYSPTNIEWAGSAIYSGTNNSAQGTTIEQCRFEEIVTTAVTLSENNNTTIRSCTFLQMGHKGVAASGDGITINQNLFRTINHKRWDPEPTTAAVKVARTDRLEMSHNYVEDLYNCQGLWLDVSNTRSTLVGNYVNGGISSLGRVAKIGLHYELSDGGRYDGVQHRSLYACNTAIGSETNVKILSSGFLDLVGNNLGGSNNIGADLYVVQDRPMNDGSNPLNKTPEQCPWWTVGNRIYNNHFADGRRQIFSNTNHLTRGISGMDHFEELAGNWFSPVSSGNALGALTTRTNSYVFPTTMAAIRNYTNVGDTSKFADSNTISVAKPNVEALAVSATAEWATAIGCPVGYKFIGNPLPIPVPTS